ncbi:MAG TPA: hypothetical protein VL899_11245 [Alphaproteobacteria bacterium]|nr:hypothetical protein [Alphaproteobacteria bacterium]
MRFSGYYIPIILGLAGAATLPAVQSANAYVSVGIGISVPIAPPILPVYEQPPIPGPGYLWTPGYWAYEDIGGYYWVPGVWVRPPRVGVLWTPPYWGFEGGVYAFHAGYWGPHIGFYGGINYGFGYGGVGFDGGYWDRGGFRYNTAYNNFGGRRITNVYTRNVTNNVTINRTAFNGGPNGVQARATQAEMAAARDRHIARTEAQTRQMTAARRDPALRAAANHGNPAIAATARAGEFHGRGAVAAKDAAPAQEARAQARAEANRTAAHGEGSRGEANRSAQADRAQARAEANRTAAHGEGNRGEANRSAQANRTAHNDAIRDRANRSNADRAAHGTARNGQQHDRVAMAPQHTQTARGNAERQHTERQATARQQAPRAEARQAQHHAAMTPQQHRQVAPHPQAHQAMAQRAPHPAAAPHPQARPAAAPRGGGGGQPHAGGGGGQPHGGGGGDRQHR